MLFYVRACLCMLISGKYDTSSEQKRLMLNNSSLYDTRRFRNETKQSMKTISKFQHVHYTDAISCFLNMNQALNYTHLLSGVISPRMKSTLFCYEGLVFIIKEIWTPAWTLEQKHAWRNKHTHILCMNDVYLMTISQLQCRVKIFISWERYGNWCPF